MGKILASEFASLDGAMEDPQWTYQFPRSEEQMKFKAEELFNADGLLLGRITYEGFAQAWPNMQDDPQGYGRKMNSISKYVVSRTLSRVDWNNSKIVRGELVEEVGKLKSQASNYLLVFGSLRLTNALIEHGLLDELTLWIFPVLVGRGRSIFTGQVKARPILTEAREFTSGTVSLHYRFEK